MLSWRLLWFWMTRRGVQTFWQHFLTALLLLVVSCCGGLSKWPAARTALMLHELAARFCVPQPLVPVSHKASTHARCPARHRVVGELVRMTSNAIR